MNEWLKEQGLSSASFSLFVNEKFYDNDVIVSSATISPKWSFLVRSISKLLYQFLIPPYVINVLIIHTFRTRGDAVGWDSALQAGRSRVRFPIVSFEFFIDINLFRPHYGPGFDSASKGTTCFPRKSLKVPKPWHFILWYDIPNLVWNKECGSLSSPMKNS
jgi:hypothetical protein